MCSGRKRRRSRRKQRLRAEADDAAGEVTADDTPQLFSVINNLGTVRGRPREAASEQLGVTTDVSKLTAKYGRDFGAVIVCEAWFTVVCGCVDGRVCREANNQVLNVAEALRSLEDNLQHVRDSIARNDRAGDHVTARVMRAREAELLEHILDLKTTKDTLELNMHRDKHKAGSGKSAKHVF